MGLSTVSRNRLVHVYSRNLTNRLTRVLLTQLIILLILSPVIICNAVRSTKARLIILVFATSIFISIVSCFTKSKTVDLVVAGAT